MAKFVRCSTKNRKLYHVKANVVLEDNGYYVVEGERYLGANGEKGQYALTSVMPSVDAGLKRAALPMELFVTDYNNLKYGNIGVSKTPPEVGKAMMIQVVEPGYGGTLNNRKYFFSDVELPKGDIVEVKYLGDKIYHVRTREDIYFILVRDVEATPSKNHVYICVCGDGFPLRYGPKTFSYIVWTQDGWIITKPNQVRLKSWDRISERVYKAVNGNTSFYVLVWHR